ncbi:ATP-binding protein [Pararhodobacter sp. CCB-MM2]|uniref:ATP-binding protein n=1 Tax=Pararhodobacter sp. CCB-MM2 TaxID=1786003 RepID=UPI000A75E25A|nr:ATP-binding protein [Pararhodobacter sp. CCB-MM2]
MRRFVRVTNIPAAISLVVVCLLWTFAEWQNSNVHQQAIRQDVSARASILRAHIEGTLSSNIQLVRGLIATLITEPDMGAARFEELAAALATQDSLIRNLAAAPEMVIRYIYPMEGNASAIGLNYLENEAQRDAAVLARDSGRLVLAGPVNLVQGGIGFISRFPVFVADGTEDGRFWGLVSSVIDAERFYAATGLADDSLSLQVTLSGADATGAVGDVFFGDATILDHDPVQMPITLPFGTWVLSAIPANGWTSTPPNLWALRLWLLVGAALIVIPSLVMGRLLEERVHHMSRLNLALRRRGQTNSRYQSVSRISRSFVWEQDTEGRLTYLSASYRHITGRHREHLLGQRLRDLAHADPLLQPEVDWAGLETRMRDRQTFSDFVCLAMTEDRGEIWLQLSGTPLVDSRGVVQGYRGAGLDVTSVQRARQAADESSRAKSIFLANMSHEIRTPLNGVLGMAQVLESQVHDPEQRAMVTTIRESGQSLNNILNDILDLSKIEANKLELETNPFQPEATLQRTVALHQLRAEEKGLTLKIFGLSPVGPARQGDVHRFGQILHNLVSNAIKFTEKGFVAVEVTNLAGSALTVRVSDSGSGMSAAQLQRLFDAFVQGDGSIARRHGGTGLGMSIVRHLVTLMQGEVDVRSVPGEGTSITISLPLAEGEMQRDLPGEALVGSDLQGLRLLAADDNATNRRVLEVMLRGTGVALTLVNDGQQAIDAWRDEDFDVVLLDISMPVVGGIAARNQIATEAGKTGRPLPPTIAFTANVMAHQVQDYLDQGFIGCVAKPLNRALLLDTLRTANHGVPTVQARRAEG